MSIKNYTALFKIQVAEMAANIGIRKTARVYQLDRKTVSDWLRRHTAGEIAQRSSKPAQKNTHPSQLSPEVVDSICSLKKAEPELTAAQIVTRLKLNCSIRTVQLKIKKQLSPAGKENGFHLLLQIEKLASRTSEILPLYIIKAKETISGQIFCSFCQENISVNMGIFTSYLLSYLQNPAGGIIYIGQGRFCGSAKTKLSFFEEIVHIAGNISLEKPKRHLSVFPFKLHKEKYHGLADFFNSVYAFLEGNLHQNTKQISNTTLLFPILTDNFLPVADKIKTEKNFWLKSGLCRLNGSIKYWEHVYDTAMIFFRSFKIEKALNFLNKILMQPALEQEICYINAILLSARIKSLTGFYKQAEHFFDRANILLMQNSDRQTELTYLIYSAKHFARSGNQVQAMSLFEKLLRRKNELSVSASVDLFVNIALLYRKKGDIANAEYYNLEACRITELCNDEKSRIAALGRTGVFYCSQGNFSKAREYYEQSGELAKQFDNNEFLANYYFNTGALFYNTGKYKEAEEWLKKSLYYSKNTELKDIKARTCILLSLQQAAIGNFGDADRYLKKAQDIGEATGFVVLLVKTWRAGAIINWQQQKSVKAIYYYEKSLEHAKKMHDYEGYITDLGNITLAYLQIHDLDKALNTAKRQKLAADKFKNPRLLIYALNNLASVYLQRAENKKAEALYTRMLKLAQKVNLKKYLLIGSYNIALLNSTSKHQKAIKQLNDLVIMSRDLNNSNYIAEATLLLAKLYLENMNRDAGIKALTESHELAQKNGKTALLTRIFDLAEEHQICLIET